MGDGNDDNGDSHAGHGLWMMVEEGDVDDEKTINDDPQPGHN